MNRPSQVNSQKNRNPGWHIAKILSMQGSPRLKQRRTKHPAIRALDVAEGSSHSIQITDRPPFVYHRLPNFHSFLSPASACSTAGFQLPGGRQSGHRPQHCWPHISPFPLAGRRFFRAAARNHRCKSTRSQQHKTSYPTGYRLLSADGSQRRVCASTQRSRRSVPAKRVPTAGIPRLACPVFGKNNDHFSFSRIDRWLMK